MTSGSLSAKFEMPKSFVGLTREEIRAKLPYVWRLKEMLDIDDACIARDSDIAAPFIRGRRVTMYPPLVHEHFNNLTELSGKAFSRLLLGKAPRDATAEFNRTVLGAVSTEDGILCGEVSRAGLTSAGRTKAEKLARVLHSDGATFLRETRAYIGDTVLLQNNVFFLEVAPRSTDGDEGWMATGLLRKLTPEGRDYWHSLVLHHIEYDYRLQPNSAG